MDERRLAQARGGVRDEPGGLVDDEQVLVLERDLETHLDGLEAGTGILQRDLDLLATPQAESLAGDRAVDRHTARGDVALGRGARADLVELGEEAVEADASRIAGNREREHG